MNASSRGGYAAQALLKGRPQACARCSRTIVNLRATPYQLLSRRPYSAAPIDPTAPPASPSQVPPPTESTNPADSQPAAKKNPYPEIPKATHTLRGGLILTRAPLLTRPLTPFEEAFFLYQKRLNERLSLPFHPGGYFKTDTPQALDWKIKIKERRMVPSREIGTYQKRGREGWNDEELVGSELASTESIYKTLLKDSEMRVTEEGEIAAPEDIVPAEQPQPRISEADINNDQKRLDRKMDRTLYLVVQDDNGWWGFPSRPIGNDEALHEAAARALRESCGVNMNTWIVGRMPVAHIVSPPTYSESNPTEVEKRGEKIFFLKGRIMAGQADLRDNKLGLKDFKWLTREELQETLHPFYFRRVRCMMADQ